MNRTLKLSLLMVCISMMLISFAAAQPTGGVTTLGPSTRGTDSVSEQERLEGGNITEVNVSGTKITTRWGGFYGSVSGGIELSDASSNNFYEWTITDFTDAVVYASSAAVSNWALAPIANATAPAFVTQDTVDDLDGTFDATEAFSSSSIGPIAATPYATTNPGTLKTYGLVDGGGTIDIWAGKVVNNAVSFDGVTIVDFQILAPAQAAGRVYNFYLEMP